MDATVYFCDAIVYALRWSGLPGFAGFYAVESHPVSFFGWSPDFMRAVVDDFGNLVRVK